MTLDEFVRLKPTQIRADKELMQLFIDFYEAAFSLKPNCAGCVFKNGFKKLKAYALKDKKIINFDKITKMETKTFQLKTQYRLKILSYKKDGIMYRKYGHAIDEAFARELVKAGKTDLFIKVPSNTSKKTEPKETKTYKVGDKIDYSSMNYRKELLPLYDVIKERVGKEATSNKKTDIIVFLEENDS